MAEILIYKRLIIGESLSALKIEIKCKYHR